MLMARVLMMAVLMVIMVTSTMIPRLVKKVSILLLQYNKQ